MDKRYSQLELFGEGQQQAPVQDDTARRKPFIFQVNRYEKTLFLLIGFIVTGVVFYCLGVEQGKAKALSKINTGFDLARGAVKPAVPAAVQPVPAVPVTAPKARPPAAATLPLQSQAFSMQAKAVRPANVTAAVPVSGKQAFTIQIGTYREKSAALREREKLASIGFSALILKKGSYNVVVVGNFTDKESASTVLSKLRRNYRDCYVRRL